MGRIGSSLTPEFLAERKRRGKVHSVYRRAVNLLFEGAEGGRMVTILAPELWGAPDCIRGGSGVFASARSLIPGMTVWKENDSISVPQADFSVEMYEEHGNSYCPSVPVHAGAARRILDAWGRFRGETGRTCGFDRMEEGRRVSAAKLLIRLTKAVLAGEERGLEKDLSRMIGMGPGLTPSFDDALVGALCLLAASRDENTLLWGGRQAFYMFLNGKTTEVSRKYLCCACERRFPQGLVRVIDKLGEESGEPLMRALSEAAETGATSGMDMLWGVAAVCHMLEREEDPYE